MPLRRRHQMLLRTTRAGHGFHPVKNRWGLFHRWAALVAAAVGSLGIHWAFPSFPNGPFSFSSRTPLGVGKGQPSDPPWTPEYYGIPRYLYYDKLRIGQQQLKTLFGFSLSFSHVFTNIIYTNVSLPLFVNAQFISKTTLRQATYFGKKPTPLHVRSRFDPSELWTSGSHSVQKYWTSVCNIRDRLCDSLAAHERPEKTEETR
jgi:hypothetical protein